MPNEIQSYKYKLFWVNFFNLILRHHMDITVVNQRILLFVSVITQEEGWSGYQSPLSSYLQGHDPQSGFCDLKDNNHKGSEQKRVHVVHPEDS